VKTLCSFRAWLLVCVTFVVLGGCNGTILQQPAPSASGANAIRGAAQQGFRAASTHLDHGRSWMSRDAKKNDLVYVSDDGTNDVYAYSYTTQTLEGTLTGFNEPSGLCVDASGDVFVTNVYDQDILEYAHGGTTAIATLSDTNEYPVGCSIDPTTGNLAVANVFGGSQLGNVAIYADAQGTPVTYADPKIGFLDFDGYDDQGNLFVDGSDYEGSGFEFAVLPKGSSTFTTISLNFPIGLPGNVMWDGKHITVGDQISNTIYRISVSGSSGKSAGSTVLRGGFEVNQYWIAGSTVLGPDSGNADVGYWPYPHSGDAKKSITGLDQPYGATISRKVK
jgi:hypothetical protein